MLSAFLSVAFSCKHQRFIGTLMLTNDWRGRYEFKKFLYDPKARAATPKLGVVLLLSGAKMFFDTSLMLYIVGLGVYLGSVWQKAVDKSAGQTESRNIFILFVVFAGLYFFLYQAMDRLTDTSRLQGWGCHVKWYNERIHPCLDGRCNKRKICGLGDEIEGTEDVTSKPTLFRRLFSWCLPGRSQCKGSCLDSACKLPSKIPPVSPSASKQEIEISIGEISPQDPTRQLA
jgi:hypothetical protein